MKNYTFRILTIILIITAATTIQAQTIATVVGNGNGVYAGDTLKAINASLHWPQALTFDKKGRLYIADALNNRIRRVSESGIITTIAGTGYLAGSGKGYYNGDDIAATAADLYNPTGVAVDTAGNVYFADMGNNRVRKIDTGGKIHTVAGDGSGSFGGDNGLATAAKVNKPERVAVDTFGNIYIAEPLSNRIRKINAGGTITTFAGTGTPTYTGDGGQASAATLMNPVDVFADKLGNVYIADELNECVRMVDPSGIITTIAGEGIPAFTGDGGPATAARLYDPTGVTLDDSGNVYISDRGNECIRKISKWSGNIETLTGTGIADSAGYRGDGGPATAAWLDFPQGLVVNSKGSLFIADQNNNRIRAIGSKTEGVHTVNPVSSSIHIYPNPSQGSFTVNIASAVSEQATIAVINVAGEKIYGATIYTNKQNEIQLNAPPGVYLLYASTSGGSGASRLVIR